MDKIPANTPRRPRPIDGWALEALMNHDELCPGLLRFALSASSFRRQATFLTLSCVFFDGPDAVAGRLRGLLREDERPAGDPRRVIGRALMTRQVRDIVSALHGPVQGLAGALNRLGDEPLPETAYRSLVDLLSRPENKARAKALLQVDKINLSTLSALRWLDPSFMHADFVRRFRSVEKIEQFNAAVDLIRQVAPHVTDDDLVASVKALGPASDLGSWARRWLAKGVFPYAPEIVDDGEWTGLRSAEAMLDAGARFSNCLKTKIPLVAVGRAFYVEYRPKPVIIELAGLSQGKWLVEGLYGPKNGRIEPDAAKAIRRKLETTGILVPAHAAEAGRFNKAARLMHIDRFSSLNTDGFGLTDDDLAEDEDLDAIVRELELGLA